MTICLLEPELEHLEKCKNILTQAFPEDNIICTSYPEQVTDIIAENEVTVLISEYNLDIMTVEEIFDLLTISSPDTVLLLMTEINHAEDLVSVYNLTEFYEIVLKPLNFNEDLVEPVRRAIAEHEKRKLGKGDICEHERSAQQYIKEYDELKKEKSKRIKDFSFIYLIFSGMVEANVIEYSKKYKHSDTDIMHIKRHANRLFKEYIDVFVFGNKTYDGYMELLSGYFDDKAKGCKIDVTNGFESKFSDSLIKQLYYFLYVVGSYARFMYSVYDVKVTVLDGGDKYIIKAENNEEAAKIGNDVIYAQEDKGIRTVIYKMTKNILQNAFLKDMKGYEETKDSVVIMLGKDN